jgi:hypothetical protein
MALYPHLSSGWFDTLTRLGRSAAHRFNQIEDSRPLRRP